MSVTESVEQALDRVTSELNESPNELIGYSRDWMDEIGLVADAVANETGRNWRLGVHISNDPERSLSFRTHLVLFESKEET